MTTVTEIREALADTIDAAMPFAVNVYATEVGQLTAPSVVVLTPDVIYGKTFGPGALTEYRFPIYVLVAQTLVAAGVGALDTYYDPTSATSVPAAIMADQTLGGVVESLFVTGFRPLNQEEAAGIGYWGGELSVTVYAR